MGLQDRLHSPGRLLHDAALWDWKASDANEAANEDKQSSEMILSFNVSECSACNKRKALPSKAACTLRLSRALAATDMMTPADEGESVLGLVVLLMMASYSAS